MDKIIPPLPAEMFKLLLWYYNPNKWMLSYPNKTIKLFYLVKHTCVYAQSYKNNQVVNY